MSRDLPSLRPQAVVRALERAGFSIVRVKGSHYHLRHPDKPGARPTVPMHRGNLPRGTLQSILRQAGLSAEELHDLL